MKTINYNKLAKITTTISFSIGTILFLAYHTTHNFELVSFGLIYIMLAAIVNICVLIMVIFKAAFDENNRTKLLTNGLLMLINIPIVFLYIALL